MLATISPTMQHSRTQNAIYKLKTVVCKCYIHIFFFCVCTHHYNQLHWSSSRARWGVLLWKSSRWCAARPAKSAPGCRDGTQLFKKHTCVCVCPSNNIGVQDNWEKIRDIQQPCPAHTHPTASRPHTHPSPLDLTWDPSRDGCHMSVSFDAQIHLNKEKARRSGSPSFPGNPFPPLHLIWQTDALAGICPPCPPPQTPPKQVE